jgi:hypothetical protein
MPSTMLITTELQHSPQPITAKESSQVVWKEKLESGELESKPKSWRLHLRSTEAELLILRLTRLTLKQLVLVMMDHALFGT